ncbi:MAG: GNAT family N-acetyltransferase [Phototrophicaceae bacterium]
MSDDLTVVRNEEKNRFEIDLGDGLAMVEYMIAGQNIVFTHTEVPVGHEGKGIASKMAYQALEYAKAEGLKVQALCPFVKKYVSEHPEYHDMTWGFEKR